MLIWGGTSDGTNPVSDTKVWALNLANPSALTWTSITPDAPNGAPSTRFGQAMVFDNVGRRRVHVSNVNLRYYRGVMVGGKNASTLNNETWSLWIDRTDATKLEWRPVPYASSSARLLPRAFHVLIRDEYSDRLMVFGGDVDSTGADPRAWSEQLPTTSDDGYQNADQPASEGGTYSYSPSWRQLDGTADQSMTGATVMQSKGPITARIPDVYDFSGSTATQSTLSGSPLEQDLYPFNFLLPDGKLFTAGPGDSSFRLATIGSPWAYYPTTAPATGLWGASAVMFRPGKIMISGSKYPEFPYANPPAVSAKSRWIDLSTGGPSSPTWNATINTMAFQRTNHNLIMLPNGQVMALGGTKQDRDNSRPVLKPELWDPDAVQGGLHGLWSTVFGGESLASHSITRGYHSTALLLPDGRILSTGGNDDSQGGQTKTQIYCPPYLFKSDGNLATRPAISNAPTVMQWGKTYTLCTSSTTGLTRACLIAAGSPTHGFDQNQRYIPLTFSTATSPTRVFVTMPPDGNTAPPGYYLLFLTGSADGGDVPSIGRWVRVIGSGDADVCDAAGPSTVTSLTPDVVTCYTVTLSWTATGDDGTLVGSGPVASFDMRRSTSSISTETAWSSALPITSPALPTPAPAGSDYSYTASGLSKNTTYYFALRERDDAPTPNLSGLHSSVSAKTMNGGCGGASLVATHGAQPAGVRGAEGASAAPTAPSEGRDAEASSVVATAGGLVVDTEPSGEGGWRIAIRRQSSVDGFDTADAGSIALQDEAAPGDWDTRDQRVPMVVEEEFGLCALRDGGRAVFLGSYELGDIATRLKSPNGTLGLVSAVSSQLGALGFDATTGPSVTLQAGEEIVLSYAPVSTTGIEDPWYLTVLKTGPATPASRLLERGGASLPARFALAQNSPNPFGASTTLRFDVPTPTRVRLEVFDLLGRRVRTLVNEQRAAGTHAIEWDRRTDGGEALHAGVFLCRMTAGSFREQRRMVLVPR